MIGTADSFLLGAATIMPATCEVSYRDRIEPIEPRVMKVLVVLAGADGRTIRRDELATACWDTADVSEDAINRVMSRLRRLGETSGAFTIRTIRTIGYRLEPIDGAPGISPPPLTPADHGEARADEAEQVAAPLKVDAAPRRRSLIHRPLMWGACLLVAVLIGAAAFLPRTRQPPVDGKRLVLADFANRTHDPIFDRTLTNLLRVDLGQSPFLDVVSEKQAQKTLMLMTRPTDAPITSAVAEEICARNNGDAVLQGEIARVGTRYLPMLTATDCSGVQVLDVEKDEVLDRDAVVPALDRLIAAMRAKLGESSRSIRAYNVPLLGEQTASLDALKSFSEAKWQWDHGHLADAITLDRHAIDLDPRFEAAYANLGVIYVSMYDEAKAADTIRKAYALRGTINERAQLQITALYDQAVTKDFTATIQNFKLWTQIYPQDVIAWSNLANAEDFIGRHAQAIVDADRAMALKPRMENPFAVLTRADLEAGRYSEGVAVGQTAMAEGLATDPTHRELLRIADARHDAAGIRREVAWASTAPAAPRTDEVEAEMALSRGQVRAASAIFDALSGSIRDRGTYDYTRAVRARLLNELGLADDARMLLTPVADQMATDADYLFVLARVGDSERAEQLLDEWLRRSPQDTLLNQVFAPEVRAALNLRGGKPLAAVAALRPALPFAPRSLDIPYLLGSAWLAAGSGEQAAAAFRMILDHPGWSPESPLYPLAKLGLARSLKLEHDMAGSARAYQSFLADLGRADPDIPALVAARTEYASLETAAYRGDGGRGISVAAASARWERERRWRSRRNPTSAGRWTSCRAHWPAAGGSAC